MVVVGVAFPQMTPPNPSAVHLHIKGRLQVLWQLGIHLTHHTCHLSPIIVTCQYSEIQIHT